MLWTWWLSLWESPSVQVNWPWGSSYRLPVPLGVLNPFHKSSKRSPRLCPILGCGFLHLFQSGPGWILSEDNYAKLLSGSITKYTLSNVRDWILPVGWVSSWAEYSLSNPPFSAPSMCLHFFVERTNLGRKGFWFGLCNKLSTGGPAWL